MTKLIFAVLIASSLLSGCASTYKLEGQTYSSADDFLAANDSLFRESQKQLVAELRAPEPLSPKTLTVGIPTLDAIKGYRAPNPMMLPPAQIVMLYNLSEGNRKELEMFADTMKELNFYREVKVMDTTGGHLQPSSTESVMYLYMAPGAEQAFQWYINGGKSGLQTINMDRGQPKFIGKAKSLLNSVKGYSLTDQD
jgi:outer membrane murein-binding lipoprotein Lpp